MPDKRTVQISAASDYFVMKKLPSDILKRLSAAELRVLLYGASGGDCGIKELAKELDLTVDEADAALTALEKLGIVNVKENKKKANAQRSSQYDSEEIAEAIDEIDSFKCIVDFATEKLEKQLNRNDLNTLFSLYDYYGMSEELICGVLEYCVSIGKRSLSFIFKTAVAMQADGIDSYEALESHLKVRRSADGKAGRFRRLCGWGSRELSAKERTYTDRWFGEMQLNFDIVKHAYEITVNNTGEVALPYMSKIIERWYANGIRTVEEAKKAEEERAKKGEKAEKGKKTVDARVEKLLMAAAEKGYFDPKEEG